MTTSSHMEVNNAQTFGDSWALGQVWVSPARFSPDPRSFFCLCVSPTHSLFHSSLALCCSCNLCVLVSLESSVIFKSNQTLGSPSVCVLCVLVSKWLHSWATVWRRLGQTAVRQEGVCSPLQRCLCTLSQRGECHWTDAHTYTYTQTNVRIEWAVERLSCLQQGTRGLWGVMGTTTNWSQWIHCSSEINTKYHTRSNATHTDTHLYV